MTIRELVDNAAKRFPERPAYHFRQKDGAWLGVRYCEYRSRVRVVAEIAGQLDLKPHQDTVALAMENRPEWIEAYAGLAYCGITVVPLDPKLKPGEVEYILRDSGAVAVFSTEAMRGTLAEVLPRVGAVRAVVLVDAAADPAPCAGIKTYGYEALQDKFYLQTRAGDSFAAANEPAEDDVASVIYTSGTTGRPKGAMLTHGNFCSDVESAVQAIGSFRSTDRFIVVLPLFHAFSFLTNFLLPMRVGACMQFAGSLRSLGEDMKLLGPSIMMGVPLLFEKLLAKVEAGVRKSAPARFLKSLGLDSILRRRVRKALGGRLRLLITGGAPCSPETIAGFAHYGITLVEGYGLTECAPIVSVTIPSDPHPGSIGPAMPGIEVRIADPDASGIGELQVRGANVMKGYLRDEAATAEAFTPDGWFRTGDLATMDADGCLYIRGRAKSLIVNREGKNIYPEEVELCLANDPLVRDFLVLGVREPGETGERVGAIIVPDLDAFMESNGGAEPPWPEIEATLRRHLQEACAKLADYKHPRKVEIRREPLERTAAQKICRHAYEGALDGR